MLPGPGSELIPCTSGGTIGDSISKVASAKRRPYFRYPGRGTLSSRWPPAPGSGAGRGDLALPALAADFPITSASPPCSGSSSCSVRELCSEREPADSVIALHGFTLPCLAWRARARASLRIAPRGGAAVRGSLLTRPKPARAPRLGRAFSPSERFDGVARLGREAGRCWSAVLASAAAT